jgi:endonuclease YncB( thermonuclease family)
MMLLIAEILIFFILFITEPIVIVDNVKRVIDGDTIVLQNGMHIRLAVVDTPERGEPGFKNATDYTKQNCLGKQAVVDIDDVQKKTYNRTVGLVYCDLELENINKSLLDKNLGIVYEKYCKSEFKELLCAQK